MQGAGNLQPNKIGIPGLPETDGDAGTLKLAGKARKVYISFKSISLQGFFNTLLVSAHDLSGII